MKEVIYNFLTFISKVILFFKRLAVKRRIIRRVFKEYTFTSTHGVTMPTNLCIDMLEYHQYTVAIKRVFSSKEKM